MRAIGRLASSAWGGVMVGVGSERAVRNDHIALGPIDLTKMTILQRRRETLGSVPTIVKGLY